MVGLTRWRALTGVSASSVRRRSGVDKRSGVDLQAGASTGRDGYQNTSQACVSFFQESNAATHDPTFLTAAMSLKEIVARPQSLDRFNFAVDVVDKWAASSSDLRALLWTDEAGENARDLSFRYFSERSRSVARLLGDLGVHKGDTIMLLLPRIPAW